MEVENNRWQAGAGTTAMSIIGTAAGGAALLGGLTGGNGLAGLFGGGARPTQGGRCQERCDVDQLTSLKAEIAKLQSEKYTDTAIDAQRSRDAATNEKVYGFVIEQDKKIATMQAQIMCLQKQIQLENKCFSRQLQNQANLTQIGLANANSAIQGLANTVAGFTKVVVPSSAVCNTNCNSCCNNQQ